MICEYQACCYQNDPEISKQTFEYLTEFTPRTSRMYLLPKINKSPPREAVYIVK